MYDPCMQMMNSDKFEDMIAKMCENKSLWKAKVSFAKFAEKYKNVKKFGFICKINEEMWKMKYFRIHMQNYKKCESSRVYLRKSWKKWKLEVLFAKLLKNVKSENLEGLVE